MHTPGSRSFERELRLLHARRDAGQFLASGACRSRNVRFCVTINTGDGGGSSAKSVRLMACSLALSRAEAIDARVNVKCACEPPRISRRLQYLRGLSHGKIEVSVRGARAGGAE